MKQPTFYIDSIAYQPQSVTWDSEGDVMYFVVKIQYEFNTIFAPDSTQPYWHNPQTGEQFAVEFEDEEVSA